MSSAGLSRTSSTSGLYDTPRTRTALPLRGLSASFSASTVRSTTQRGISPLTSAASSMNRVRYCSVFIFQARNRGSTGMQ